MQPRTTQAGTGWKRSSDKRCRSEHRRKIFLRRSIDEYVSHSLAKYEKASFQNSSSAPRFFTGGHVHRRPLPGISSSRRKYGEKTGCLWCPTYLSHQFRKSLSVNYGGFHIGDMLFDVQHLEESETLAAIHAIELSDRISIVAPKLITTATIDSTPRCRGRR